MEIKITFGQEPLSLDQMEEVAGIMDQLTTLVTTYEQDLQDLRDDFTTYGTIKVVEDDDKAWNQGNDIAENIRKRVAERTAASTPQSVIVEIPDGIKQFIYTEHGSRIMVTELVSGPNKGKIALMWPCGSFLHNCRHTTTAVLWARYEEANVPEIKRAI